jgi:hypothetical protein
MDCENKVYRVDLCINDALYDESTGYLRVEGQVRNRLREKRQFNLRNWVYRLKEKGHYLKAKSVGLPVVLLPPVRSNGSAYEEKFTLVFKIGPSKSLSDLIIDYADQFNLTGKVNKIIMTVPLHVSRGTVTARG